MPKIKVSPVSLDFSDIATKFVLYLILAIVAVIVMGIYFPTIISTFTEPWLWVMVLPSIGIIYYTQSKLTVIPLAIISGLVPWFVKQAAAVVCAPSDWICNLWQSISGIFLLVPRLIDLGLHIGVAFIILWLIAALVVREK